MHSIECTFPRTFIYDTCLPLKPVSPQPLKLLNKPKRNICSHTCTNAYKITSNPRNAVETSVILGCNRNCVRTSPSEAEDKEKLPNEIQVHNCNASVHLTFYSSLSNPPITPKHTHTSPPPTSLQTDHYSFSVLPVFSERARISATGVFVFQNRFTSPVIRTQKAQERLKAIASHHREKRPRGVNGSDAASVYTCVFFLLFQTVFYTAFARSRFNVAVAP